MASSPWFTEDEKRAWTPFVVATLHLLATLDAELKAAFDLSHLDYGMMMLLIQSATRMLRMSALAAAFGVDPSTITYRVRRLEARGLVARSASLTDGRVTFVYLTDDGLALLRQAQLVHVQGARRYFLDHLAPTELQAIAAIFGKIRSFQQPPTEDAFAEPDLPNAAAPDKA